MNFYVLREGARGIRSVVLLILNRETFHSRKAPYIRCMLFQNLRRLFRHKESSDFLPSLHSVFVPDTSNRGDDIDQNLERFEGFLISPLRINRWPLLCNQHS